MNFYKLDYKTFKGGNDMLLWEFFLEKPINFY